MTGVQTCALPIYHVRYRPITYKFSAAEGAVLQAPEGSVVIEAQNVNEFYDLAVRHAQNWYEYMLSKRSRDIPNGSLYLITGCIKTRNWGIGTLYGQPANTDYLEFISGGQPPGRTYGWKKSGPIATKVGPTSTDIAPADDEEPNQCVFIRGYKITLGEKLWKKLKQTTVSVYSSKETPFGLRFSTSDSSNQSSSRNPNISFHGGSHGSFTHGHITHRYRDYSFTCIRSWSLQLSQYISRLCGPWGSRSGLPQSVHF